jgi:pyruvate decarboxylase
LGRFFSSGDLILVETGSVSIEMIQATLPMGVFMFNQTLWGSIGYVAGSAVGAFTAVKEQGKRFKRNILITGDGSIQMIVQAVSDLLRLDLKPIMSVNPFLHRINRCTADHF